MAVLKACRASFRRCTSTQAEVDVVEPTRAAASAHAVTYSRFPNVTRASIRRAAFTTCSHASASISPSRTTSDAARALADVHAIRAQRATSPCSHRARSHTVAAQGGINHSEDLEGQEGAS